MAANNDTRVVRRRGGPLPQLELKATTATPQRSVTLAAPTTTTTVTGAAPVVSATFQAAPDSNTTIPPDTCGTVGPDALLVTLNDRVRVQSKSNGALVIADQTPAQFWSAAGGTSPFDPSSVYDVLGGRYVVCAADAAESANSALLVAVSTGASATAGWYKFRIDADASNLAWADFPRLGVNQRWVTISVNMFSVAANAFQYAALFVIDKATLYAGSLSVTRIALSASDGGGWCPALSVLDQSLSANVHHVVQRYTPNAGDGNGYLRVGAVQSTGGTPTFVSQLFLVAGPAWSDAPPTLTNGGFLPQLGSTSRIDAGDDRVQNVVGAAGTLWLAHTVFLPATATPSRAAVQWWQLNVGSLSVAQRNLVDGGLTSRQYAFPSVTCTTDSTRALIGFSVFGTDIYASAGYVTWEASSGANNASAPVIFKAGETTYYKTFGGTENRWGDYSATRTDPSLPNTTLWTIQEYAASPANTWGTWWARVDFSAPIPPPTTMRRSPYALVGSDPRTSLAVYTRPASARSEWRWRTLTDAAPVYTAAWGDSSFERPAAARFGAGVNPVSGGASMVAVYGDRPDEVSVLHAVVNNTLPTGASLPAYIGSRVTVGGDFQASNAGDWFLWGNLEGGSSDTVYDRIVVVRTRSGNVQWSAINTISCLVDTNVAPAVLNWGTTGDIPLLGDVLGIGRDQYVVYRPSTSTWYAIDPRNLSNVLVRAFGAGSNVVPVLGDWLGKGYDQLGTWSPASAEWLVLDQLAPGAQPISRIWGNVGDLPLEGCFQTRGVADFAVWRPSNLTWYIGGGVGGPGATVTFGVASTDLPIPAAAVYWRGKRMGLFA